MPITETPPARALDGAPPPAVDEPPAEAESLQAPEFSLAEATPDQITERADERATDEQLEPRYMILVHNDDVTPYEYVLSILGRVFLLSEEIAEHVAWTAHSDGQAVVMIRPREEAKRLIAVAHSRARMDGYPLAFTMEPEP